MTLTTAEPTALEMTKDLAMAQLQSGQLPREHLCETLEATHANLMGLRARGGAAVASGPTPTPGASDWRKSISKFTITCLECGASFKQLSKRHLREHDLTVHLYRRKYGIPRLTPLAAKATTARRRQIMQETRPWEKSPRYLEQQAAGTLGTTAAAPKKRRAAAKGSA